MINIKDKKLCCGCSACINACPKGCITMEKDEEGFSYPKVNEAECIHCGLCERVCPILNAKGENSGETRAYAVVATKESLRRNSTSGGVFPLLAERVIENGGVVFGSAFDQEFKVCHIPVSDKEGIETLQGSKYVQSDMKDSYSRIKKLLEEGRQVLFSGTPCQTEGLRSFLRKEYENLFMVDIVCHGVPSPLMWEEYKALQVKKHKAPISSVAFRNKDFGWINYRVKLTFENGKEYSSRNWDDMYLRSYLMDIISRPSCYDCKFRKWHRESDITLADFWGVEQVLKDWNDDKGISLVMVHSLKGAEMLERISDKIKMQEVIKEAAISKNHSIASSDEIPQGRAEFWKLFSEKGYEKTMDKCVMGGLVGKAKRLIRGFMG